MTISQKVILQSVIGALLVTASASAFSTEGVSTFASFYHQGSWVSWGWAGLAAVTVGIMVFIGWPILGPAITPIIGSIGTSIGSVMGLSGIAATNAGLAFLGGGAIATGGFGILGGTALLAAALTFGTEVTIDYAVGSLYSKYERRKFSDASLKMMTLPLPVNTSGPGSVEAAGQAIESTVVRDSWECVKQFPDSVNGLKHCIDAKQKPQHQMVRDALLAMDANRNSTTGSDVERESAMYALLHFLNNDYVAAKKYALRAYKLGIKSSGTPTLPAFIYAASLLYDDSPNLNESHAKFQFAVTAEPNNPLTPVLFSAYLDRLSYRLNDGAVGVDQIDRLGKFAELLPDDVRKLTIQQTILSHDLMQIKVAQQRILSLSRTQNSTIKENPKTLEAVKSSMRDYVVLIKVGNSLHTSQKTLLEMLSRDGTWWDSIRDGKNPFKNPGQMLAEHGWPDSVQKFKIALVDYERNQKQLEDRVAAFEKEIGELKAPKQISEPAVTESQSPIEWIKGLFK